MEDVLPADVVWRKKKMGFPFPYETFFAESKAIIDLIITSSKSPYLEPFLKDLSQNDLPSNWRVLSFILWYELFFNNNTALFESIRTLAGAHHSYAEYGYDPKFLETCKMSFQ